MPKAKNGDINIYYEVEGDGPPLVLAHGGSDSLDILRTLGYTEALKDDFQLILFDSRGQERSDKPHEAFDRRTRTADNVVAILDNLGISKAHYFGYSRGAMTGYTLAIRHAERFHCFILGGMTPYQWPEEMVKAMNISIEGFKLLRTDPEAYMQWMENLLGRPLTPEDRSEFLSRDPEASIAMQTAFLNTPSLTDQDLAGILVPCLVFCGDLDPFHDGAKESVNHMPRAAFASLTGLNHITAFARSDLVVPYIKAFLAVVSRE